MTSLASAKVRSKCKYGVSVVVQGKTMLYYSNCSNKVYFCQWQQLFDSFKQPCGYIPKSKLVDGTSVVLSCGHHKTCLTIKIRIMGNIQLSQD